MGGFELDAKVNPNKVFLVQLSKLENRFDANFYKFDYLNLLSKIKASHFYKLKDIVNFSSESWNQKDYFENEFPYIEISEIDLENGNLADVKKVLVNEAPSRAKMIIRPNDVIVSTTRPSRGAIAYCDSITDISIGSTGFAVIRDSLVYDKQLLTFLLKQPFALMQMEQRSSGGNYPAITQPELGNICIPHIEKDLQNKISEKFENAHQQKQQKEQQIQALLDGIDGYLLNSLGITLPKKDHRLEKRIFTVPLSEVTGGRLDSDFYREFYLESIQSLGAKFGVKSIRDLSTDVFQGVGKDEVEFSEFTLLKVKNIKTNNELDFSDTEFIASIPPQKILLENDIISPFIGEAIKQYKFSNFSQSSGIYAVDNNTGIIRINQDKCSPRYVCEVLNSVIGKFQIDRQIGGGGVPFLGSNGAKKFVIPLPPIEKQNEIAAHIAQIRAATKQLQAEATKLLATAKADIERMILGEAA